MSLSQIFAQKISEGRRHELFKLIRPHLNAQHCVLSEVDALNHLAEERYKGNVRDYAFALSLAEEQGIPFNSDGSVTLTGLLGPKTVSRATREPMQTAYNTRSLSQLCTEEGFIAAHLHVIFGEKAAQALEELYNGLPAQLTNAGYVRANTIKDTLGKSSFHAGKSEGWTRLPDLVDIRIAAASIAAKIENPAVIHTQISIINRIEKNGLMCDMSAPLQWVRKLRLY